MREEKRTKILELLADEAIFGLSDSEKQEFDVLKTEFPELAKDKSFEIAASSINLVETDLREKIPHNLQVKILNDADKFFDSRDAKENTVGSKSKNGETSSTKTKNQPFWQWLGWAVAGAACIALVANIWVTQQTNQETVDGRNPVQTPTPAPDIKAERRVLLAKAGVIQTNWSPVQKDEKISGDVIWSDSEQKGYMRLKGLPVNDKNKQTYQLWIFDKNQDEKTPVDGGIFDVERDGEIIVPINAKLRIKDPKMFAVTVEKPGGVVVSKREKIVALGKVS